MNIVEYTEFLVKSICKDADMIKVNCYEDETGKKIDILVPEHSFGVLLGKEGRNIKAIRTLIHAYAYLHQEKNVDVQVEAF